jgi:hypothetical protein
MRRVHLLLAFLVSFCLTAIHSSAQPWAGIVDPSRAVDWSQAGIPGGVPTRSIRCGSVIAAYNGAATTINNAIAACAAGQYVELGAGTFNLTSGITFGGHNNVTLRGQGADTTLLVFTGGGAGFYNSLVSMESTQLNENDVPANVCDVTGGYSQGSVVLTLANCGSTTPAKGSLSNLHVGGILMMDQLDEANDTGTLWNCLAGVAEGGTQCANNPTGSSGFSRNNGTCNSPLCYRSQIQTFVVTAINGASITVTPPVYVPNWRSSQKPQAWFVNSASEAVGMGLENLTVNNCSSMAGTTCNTSSGSGQNITIGNCDQCYVKGVRSVFANRSHVRTLYSTRSQIQDNYTFENISHATVSYGIEIVGSNNLVVNNILQQNTDSEPSCSGPCEGNVIAYNFNIDNVYGAAGWMQAGFYEHSSGSAFNLWEGNIGPGYNADDVHGTHLFDTVLRNRLIGNQTAGCGGPGANTCTAQTTPVIIQAGARYFNVIGNVLGQSGLHNNYWCNATSTATCSSVQTTIYSTGYTGNGGQQQSAVNGFCGQPACTSHGAFDPQVGASLMRWGNYDTATNTVRWVSSEVPSALSPYGNAVPASQTLPASFYLSVKPSWFGSIAWPAIGPEVTGGNISGAGGHANMNPAMACYVNVMGGSANGTGNVLTFNASSCYASSSGITVTVAAPTNLTYVIQ